MNQLVRTFIFIVSAVLLLAGAALYITEWEYAAFLFAIGAAGLTLIYSTEPHKYTDIRRRRLQRFNLMAGVLMIAASMLMFNDRNEWMLCLTIAAILQFYAAFAAPKGDKKE